MYHIYSPENHKVYWVGAARVEDGKGLDNPYNKPCLEDRVSLVQAKQPKQSNSETNSNTAMSSNDDEDDILSNIEDDISELHSNNNKLGTELASDDDTSSSKAVSKYFA
jgi:hypothetical protein